MSVDGKTVTLGASAAVSDCPKCPHLPRQTEKLEAALNRDLAKLRGVTLEVILESALWAEQQSKLGEVRPSDIREVLDGARDRGLSRQTVVHIKNDMAGIHEFECAKPLRDSIPESSLTVLDRGYLSASFLLGIETKNDRHWRVFTLCLVREPGSKPGTPESTFAAIPRSRPRHTGSECAGRRPLRR